MGVDKFNAEGYHDPTTYQALTNIVAQEKAAKKAADFCNSDAYKPLVYVCSPYSGDVENNVIKARRYCRFALENLSIPIAVHLLYPQFLDDNNPAERYFALHTINYVLLGKCREVWVFGDYISPGMRHEINLAKKRRLKVRYFTDDLEEVES